MAMTWWILLFFTIHHVSEFKREPNISRDLESIDLIVFAAEGA